MDPLLETRIDPLLRKEPDLSLLPERRLLWRDSLSSPLLPLCLSATGTLFLSPLMERLRRGGLLDPLNSPELSLRSLLMERFLLFERLEASKLSDEALLTNEDLRRATAWRTWPGDRVDRLEASKLSDEALFSNDLRRVTA